VSADDVARGQVNAPNTAGTECAASARVVMHVATKLLAENCRWTTPPRKSCTRMRELSGGLRNPRTGLILFLRSGRRGERGEAVMIVCSQVLLQANLLCVVQPATRQLR